MQEKIQAEIIIKATPEKVWNVLTQFDDYPSRGVFIKEINGQVKEGQKIIIKLQSSPSKEFTFKPKVITYRRNEELRWIGHFLFKGLFDGEHFFILQDNEDGTTRFIQCEYFSGILVPLLKNMIHGTTLNNFRHMNLKIKELAEASN